MSGFQVSEHGYEYDFKKRRPIGGGGWSAPRASDSDALTPQPGQYFDFGNTSLLPGPSHENVDLSHLDTLQTSRTFFGKEQYFTKLDVYLPRSINFNAVKYPVEIPGQLFLQELSFDEALLNALMKDLMSDKHFMNLGLGAYHGMQGALDLEEDTQTTQNFMLPRALSKNLYEFMRQAVKLAAPQLVLWNPNKNARMRFVQEINAGNSLATPHVHDYIHHGNQETDNFMPVDVFTMQAPEKTARLVFGLMATGGDVPLVFRNKNLILPDTESEVFPKPPASSGFLRALPVEAYAYVYNTAGPGTRERNAAETRAVYEVEVVDAKGNSRGKALVRKTEPETWMYKKAWCATRRECLRNDDNLLETTERWRLLEDNTVPRMRGLTVKYETAKLVDLLSYVPSHVHTPFVAGSYEEKLKPMVTREVLRGPLNSDFVVGHTRHGANLRKTIDPRDVIVSFRCDFRDMTGKFFNRITRYSTVFVPVDDIVIDMRTTWAYPKTKVFSEEYAKPRIEIDSFGLKKPLAINSEESLGNAYSVQHGLATSASRVMHAGPGDNRGPGRILMEFMVTTKDFADANV